MIGAGPAGADSLVAAPWQNLMKDTVERNASALPCRRCRDVRVVCLPAHWRREQRCSRCLHLSRLPLSLAERHRAVCSVLKDMGKAKKTRKFAEVKRCALACRFLAPCAHAAAFARLRRLLNPKELKECVCCAGPAPAATEAQVAVRRLTCSTSHQSRQEAEAKGRACEAHVRPRARRRAAL